MSNIKIHKNTPYWLIKQAMYRDFGIVLDNSDAEQIRSSNILWTDEKLICTAGYISRITREGVKLASGAFYTIAEWNREYLETAKKQARHAQEKWIIESVEWDIKADDELETWFASRK